MGKIKTRYRNWGDAQLPLVGREPQDDIKCKVWEAECWQGDHMGARMMSLTGAKGALDDAGAQGRGNKTNVEKS
jgi:hypothetical protein